MSDALRLRLGEDIGWARQVLTLLYAGLQSHRQKHGDEPEPAAPPAAPSAPAPAEDAAAEAGDAASGAPAAPDAAPPADADPAKTNRAVALTLVRDVMSWLEDAAGINELLQRTAGQPEAKQAPPPALVTACHHLSRSLDAVRFRYARMTGQPLAEAVEGVAAAAGAADGARDTAEAKGRLVEAAVWSPSAARRALAVAAHRLAGDWHVTGTSPEEAASVGAAPPPGHTAFSWGSRDGPDRSSSGAGPHRVDRWSLPPGHTPFSWGRGPDLDDVANELYRLCMRHRVMAGEGSFRLALRGDVSVAVARQRRAAAAAAGATAPDGDVGAGAVAGAVAGDEGSGAAVPGGGAVSQPAPSEGTGGGPSAGRPTGATAARTSDLGPYSPGNFAFGVSSAPSVLSVLVDPNVVGALQSQLERMSGKEHHHADGQAAAGTASARMLVVGSSTGVIPLVLSAGSRLPCDGIEILPSLHRLSESERLAFVESLSKADSSRRRSHTDSADPGAAGLGAAAAGAAASEPSGPATLSATARAVAGSVFVLGDAVNVALPAESGSYVLAWLTSLCWDDAVRGAVLERLCRELAVGSLVVDYCRPPAALLRPVGRGGTGADAGALPRRGRRLAGLARVVLPPGGVTWAPAASGVRQTLWVSRVVQDE